MAQPEVGESSSNPRHDASRVPMCVYAARGYCRYGNACKFSHIPPRLSAVQDRNLPIKPTGAPKRRSRKRASVSNRMSRTETTSRLNSSTPPSITNNTPEDSCNPSNESVQSSSQVEQPENQVPQEEKKEEDAECGICMDDPSSHGKRYGILTNCDHVFCLDCLRKWRSRVIDPLSMSQSSPGSTRKTCPLCRKKSPYIIPSFTFCTGMEKQQLLDMYKKNCAEIVCKHFDSSQTSGLQSCPFGPRCLYKHVDSNGVVVDKDQDAFERPGSNRRASRAARRRYSRRRRELREQALLFDALARDGITDGALAVLLHEILEGS